MHSTIQYNTVAVQLNRFHLYEKSIADSKIVVCYFYVIRVSTFFLFDYYYLTVLENSGVARNYSHGGSEEEIINKM